MENLRKVAITKEEFLRRLNEDAKGWLGDGPRSPESWWAGVEELAKIEFNKEYNKRVGLKLR